MLKKLLVSSIVVVMLTTLVPVSASAAPPPAINPDIVRSAAAASGLTSLASEPLPKVPNMDKILNTGAAARAAAVQLGKAFFWDMQAGSDGQACASCHFSAGADIRSRNQLSPDLKNTNPALRNVFDPTASGASGGPNYQLVAEDFPFHQLDDPENNNFDTRIVDFDTNDVTSSMGDFSANFAGVGAPLLDANTPRPDPVFNVGGNNTRRVEPRNTPTMINAVFNHSNFWDGRAHNLFNGVSVIGPLDTTARIWVNTGRAGAAPARQAVSIPNSSLASQAVGPPTSDFEMSFFDRPFPQIGRKLLNTAGITPLGQQLVAPTDSVLGSLSNFPSNGINATYSALIKKAFQSRYWNGANVVLDLPGTAFDGSYTQMEANFTLFWGMAIQMYETTLVSDASPLDSFLDGNNSALTQEQLQGLLVFLNQGPGRNPAVLDNAIAQAEAATGAAIGVGNCVSCHRGAAFTEASFGSLGKGVGNLELIELEDTAKLVDGILAPDPAVKGLLDAGFSNIGVRPEDNDLGRGADGDFPFPLSFVRQLLVDPNFTVPAGAELPAFDPAATRVQVDGAFKIPDLRNVELTGPYFHNGGQSFLRQVVEFYDRQGDFGKDNINELDQNMVFIDLEDEDEDPLVAFLLSLTDNRVRIQAAPFDHPEVRVPNGSTNITQIGPLEPRITIAAVGAAGDAANPVKPFLNLDPSTGLPLP